MSEDEESALALTMPGFLGVDLFETHRGKWPSSWRGLTESSIVILNMADFWRISSAQRTQSWL